MAIIIYFFFVEQRLKRFRFQKSNKYKKKQTQNRSNYIAQKDGLLYFCFENTLTHTHTHTLDSMQQDGMDSETTATASKKKQKHRQTNIEGGRMKKKN